MVVVFALSLVGAVMGQWWGLAFPIGAGLLGILLFATGEPTPGGGDADPQRPIGGGLIIVAIPWAVVYAVVVVARRRLRRG